MSRAPDYSAAAFKEDNLGTYSGPGLWHFLDSPAILQTTSQMGFAWHVLDMQHGLWREPDIVAALAAAPRHNIAVRLRSGSYADIGSVLDAGAAHIIVPMINTAAEAQEVVFGARYAPQGGRSWGPMSALFGATVLSPDEANSRIHVSVMIESAEGLENLDAILETPGINSVFVGPFDLAMSLGTDVDALLATENSPLRRIATACQDRQVEVGAFAGTSARATAFAALGYDWATIDTDIGLLKAGAAGALAG